MRGRHVAAILVFAVAGVGLYGLRAGWLVIPADYNPWAELDATARTNLLTRLKLRRTRDDLPRCLAALRQLDARYTKVPDRDAGSGCGFQDALRLSGIGALQLQPPVVLSCRAALSFGMWVRHAVQPSAEAYLDAPVSSIRNLGSYACRDVNTGEPASRGARRSRHATADALDVAAFAWADGHAVAVDRDWARSDATEPPGPSAFLRDAHAGACLYFDGVLGPDYNAVHRNHFHLEDGGWPACR
jgi:hypothetical protein